ncbi:MAG TPA: alpha/beta hydrolase [Sphingorhabdus lacus]|jgi:pimeloyl-ACP methyl ester carboxylesterase|uniref:alpha/beta fold hydrolase n=1 Tax=Sphingorhabdus lacus TaxID=392610 RepID=UPI002CADCDE5|nr:alpha/beta hydrolase [Sphingorhabdus lacus]HPV67237.1 alpha/beta hydrolase [Sphingorhabdus lacus]
MTLHGPITNSFISQRLRLNYVDWGNPDAPPLLLVHGGRDHARSWDWVAEELRNDWHIIAPDLRGHGDSSWSPDGSYEMSAFVYDMAQLIHQLGLAPVSIIAHSMGGNIATRYAGIFPENVRKLVNIEGLGLSPKMQAERDAIGIQKRFRQWIEDKRNAAGRTPKRYPTIEAAYDRMKAENSYLTDEQARHLTVHGISRNEDGTWSWKFDNYLNIWAIFDMPREDLLSIWQSITCPMLLLYGEKSWASNPEKDGRIEHFPTAKVVEYENAGHWLHHDQFDRFMADVKAFL